MREQKGGTTKKRRPKKKKRPAAEDGAQTGEAKDEARPAARGIRASFAANYPRDPKLDALVDAFDAGHHAYVQEHAAVLAESAEDEDVRRAARELRQRLQPGPHMTLLMLLPLALLAFLAVYYLFVHGH